MVQIGESAVDEGTHEIERECRALVAAQQQIRIRSARVGRELGPVDQIATVARERHAVTRLGVRRARLRILACHAPDTQDRSLEPVQQDEAHLQEDLELLGDLIRLAVGKGLRAIATLQQEGLTALGGRQTLAQRVDLP
jgi:hypothetical protein